MEIKTGDSLDLMDELDSGSAHMAVTDPPYGLDGLDLGWAKGEGGPRGTGSVGGLPVGMRFDREQSAMIQAFAWDLGRSLRRVLKPGAFAAVFSMPRLSHRMAAGLEDAGFEIRDIAAWRFTRKAQFKAFSLDRFAAEADRPKLAGRKTPQLRPQYEAVILAQNPKRGTFVENWLAHGVGLMDPQARLNGGPPSNVMLAEKPEKDGFNKHLTVKPVEIVRHLIELFTLPGQVVLDPFLGSGTTAVAAEQAGRDCIGMEINPEYVEIARKRLY